MSNSLFFKHYADYPSDIQRGWTEELQGVTHDDTNWFIVQKKRIWKIPLKVDLYSEINASDLSRGILTANFPEELHAEYDHLGDPDHFNGLLFVPVEKTESDMVARIACFDAQTLQFIGSALLPEQGNHAPWCAVNPGDGLLYSSSFDYVNELFAYRFTLENDQLNITLDHRAGIKKENTNTLLMDGLQGGVFAVMHEEIFLFLSSNNDDIRGIHAFSWPALRHIQFEFIDTEYLTFGEEIEGITFWDLDGGESDGIRGQIHLIELDNDSLNSDDLKCFKHYNIYFSPFVANKNLSKREVHKAGCAWINFMKPEHKVPYSSLTSAIKDGYDGCHYCLGEFDTR